MARQNFCPAAGLVGLNRCGNQLLMRDVSSTRRTIVFVGWRGMKTTYEKDSFYYAGEGTKTGAPGYEYSNLMFQTSSHCYYTSYDHCVEASVVLWKRIPEAKPVEQFQKIYNCTGSAIDVGDGKALTLQTSTLTLVYEQDLKVISGTQTATVPFLNSLFQECNVEVGSGYYGDLLLGAKNVAVKDSQINHLNVQSEKYITVNGSNLDNVTLSGEEVELSNSQFSGQISAKVVRAKGSSILRRLAERRKPSFTGKNYSLSFVNRSSRVSLFHQDRLCL